MASTNGGASSSWTAPICIRAIRFFVAIKNKINPLVFVILTPWSCDQIKMISLDCFSGKGLMLWWIACREEIVRSCRGCVAKKRSDIHVLLIIQWIEAFACGYGCDASKDSSITRRLGF